MVYSADSLCQIVNFKAMTPWFFPVFSYLNYQREFEDFCSDYVTAL